MSDIDALAAKMKEAAEKALHGDQDGLVWVFADNTIAVLADREKLKEDRDDARKQSAIMVETIADLEDRLAEVERERDTAWDTANYWCGEWQKIERERVLSEATLLRVLGRATDALKRADNEQAVFHRALRRSAKVIHKAKRAERRRPWVHPDT